MKLLQVRDALLLLREAGLLPASMRSARISSNAL